MEEHRSVGKFDEGFRDRKSQRSQSGAKTTDQYQGFHGWVLAMFFTLFSICSNQSLDSGQDYWIWSMEKNNYQIWNHLRNLKITFIDTNRREIPERKGGREREIVIEQMLHWINHRIGRKIMLVSIYIWPSRCSFIFWRFNFFVDCFFLAGSSSSAPFT